MLNALSVDVEDWYHVGAFERVIDRADWPRLERRVEANTDRVLALFAEAGVHATFFTLGSVAAAQPALMRRIVAGGHELASHGWDHRRVWTMTADEFRADCRTARAAIEDAGGTRVTGYRAPSFSIDPRTPWAHAVLAEDGYRYSSSVAPIAHDHYGWPGSPVALWRPLADAALVELPIATGAVFGRPINAGGGFFRLLPYGVTAGIVEAANARAQPTPFYFHPWEIDPDQPRVAGAPWRSRVRHYARLGAMAGKLRRLTRDYPWDRYDRVVDAERRRAA